MTPCLGPEPPQTMIICSAMMGNMGGVRMLSASAFYSSDRFSSERFQSQFCFWRSRVALMIWTARENEGRGVGRRYGEKHPRYSSNSLQEAFFSAVIIIFTRKIKVRFGNRERAEQTGPDQLVTPGRRTRLVALQLPNNSFTGWFFRSCTTADIPN